MRAHEAGQPVLVGTISVEVSELLSKRLAKRGIKHTVLNAKPEFAEREVEAACRQQQQEHRLRHDLGGDVQPAVAAVGGGFVGAVAREAFLTAFA